jgi:hypothetical protein
LSLSRCRVLARATWFERVRCPVALCRQRDASVAGGGLDGRAFGAGAVNDRSCAWLLFGGLRLSNVVRLRPQNQRLARRMGEDPEQIVRG